MRSIIRSLTTQVHRQQSLAGKITSASDFGFTQTERVIQLGLKYSF